MKIFGVLVLCLAMMAGYGQNFKEEFTQLTSRIEQATSCHIVSNVTIYESKKNKQKLLSFSAELKKSESAYRSKMGDVELISNNDFIIMVDSEDLIVQIEKTPKVSKSDREFLKDFYAIDSMSHSNDSIQFVSQEGDFTTYRITMKKAMIETITVVLNNQERSIKRIEYEYNKSYFPTGNYVVIEYTLFNLNASFEQSIFEGRDIVTKNGNAFALSEKYKGFELLNLYEKE